MSAKPCVQAEISATNQVLLFFIPDQSVQFDRLVGQFDRLVEHSGSSTSTLLHISLHACVPVWQA